MLAGHTPHKWAYRHFSSVQVFGEMRRRNRTKQPAIIAASGKQELRVAVEEPESMGACVVGIAYVKMAG